MQYETTCLSQTTIMQYGHGKNGLFGITLKQESLKVWRLSLHVCSRTKKYLNDLKSSEINTD